MEGINFLRYSWNVKPSTPFGHDPSNQLPMCRHVTDVNVQIAAKDNPTHTSLLGLLGGGLKVTVKTSLLYSTEAQRQKGGIQHEL